jgi:hypothetical protein
LIHVNGFTGDARNVWSGLGRPGPSQDREGTT